MNTLLQLVLALLIAANSANVPASVRSQAYQLAGVALQYTQSQQGGDTAALPMEITATSTTITIPTTFGATGPVIPSPTCTLTATSSPNGSALHPQINILWETQNATQAVLLEHTYSVGGVWTAHSNDNNWIAEVPSGISYNHELNPQGYELDVTNDIGSGVCFLGQ